MARNFLPSLSLSTLNVISAILSLASSKTFNIISSDPAHLSLSSTLKSPLSYRPCSLQCWAHIPSHLSSSLVGTSIAFLCCASVDFPPMAEVVRDAPQQTFEDTALDHSQVGVPVGSI